MKTLITTKVTAWGRGEGVCGPEGGARRRQVPPGGSRRAVGGEETANDTKTCLLPLGSSPLSLPTLPPEIIRQSLGHSGCIYGARSTWKMT